MFSTTNNTLIQDRSRYRREWSRMNLPVQPQQLVLGGRGLEKFPTGDVEERNMESALGRVVPTARAAPNTDRPILVSVPTIYTLRGPD